MKRNRFKVETIITMLREEEVHLSKRNDYGLAYRPAISEKEPR